MVANTATETAERRQMADLLACARRYVRKPATNAKLRWRKRVADVRLEVKKGAGGGQCREGSPRNAAGRGLAGEENAGADSSRAVDHGGADGSRAGEGWSWGQGRGR